MQTPKSKSNHLDGPQRTVLRSSFDSVSSSPHQTTQPQKDRTPKSLERRSPRGGGNEKRSSKVSELEASITQIQEELKKAKDQATSSDLKKRQVQKEVEEVKKQITAMSAKLKETNRQLMEISSSEDDRVQELCKISQDRDRVWESELETVRKQHSLDLDALTNAMYEIQKLKRQLEMATDAEAVQTERADFAEGEIRKLQFKLSESQCLVERLKADLRQCKESEVQAHEMLCETQRMLETASLTTEKILSDNHEAAVSFISLSTKLEKSEDGEAAATEPIIGDKDNEETSLLKKELNYLRSEVSTLRAALDAAEVRYEEEYIQSTLQIRSAYELVDVAKSESRSREAELEHELKRVKSDLEALGVKLKQETEKPRLSDKENVWATELKKARASLVDIKAVLSEKENQLQSLIEENETLKLEVQKVEIEKTKAIKEAASSADAVKVAETKLTHLTQEADRNSRKLEQAAQTANTEMEAELRRLKVQCDQWRKAAEAAAVMLTTDNGKYMERSESLDSSYHNTIARHLGSPYSDDMEDDTSKKKNGNMLQKFGVLWKKSNTNKQI